MGALVKPLLRLCDAIALVALAVLFGVVAVSVLGRALFDATGHAVNLMIPAKRSVWAVASFEFRNRRLWIDDQRGPFATENSGSDHRRWPS
jgi:hypothetical protein